MDRPLPFDPQRRAPLGREHVAVRVVEVAEGAVDGPEAVGAAGHHHPRQGEVPLVARIVGVEPADDHGAGPATGRIVGHAEVHRLQPPAGLRDRLHVGHAQRRLDQDVDPDPVGDPLGGLDLGQQRIHQIDVRGHPHLGDEHRVEAVAGDEFVRGLEHVAVTVQAPQLRREAEAAQHWWRVVLWALLAVLGVEAIMASRRRGTPPAGQPILGVAAGDRQ
jgi:hypothetical protein